jgi:hypothetical protein
LIILANTATNQLSFKSSITHCHCRSPSDVVEELIEAIFGTERNNDCLTEIVHYKPHISFLPVPANLLSTL